MHIYDAEYIQIANNYQYQINVSRFAKFNAFQSYPLYGTLLRELKKGQYPIQTNLILWMFFINSYSQ